MSELSDADKRAQAAAWAAGGGFFQRFNGVDHACMPVPDWRWFLETARKRAALASAPQASQPPQGASSLLPGWKWVPVEPTAAMRAAWCHAEMADDHDQSKRYEARFSAGTAGAYFSWLAGYRAMLSASPLPAPQEPAQVYRHYKGGLYEIVAMSNEESTGTPLVTYRAQEDGRMWSRPLSEWLQKFTHVSGPAPTEVEGAAPAPVDPESQGAPYTQLMSDSVTVNPISATQPASPARELTDAELTVIGAKHLEAHAQFVGAGEVWVEGEVDFARAVIARDRALREQG